MNNLLVSIILLVVFFEYSYCEDIPGGVSKDIEQEYRAQSGGLVLVGIFLTEFVRIRVPQMIPLS